LLAMGVGCVVCPSIAADMFGTHLSVLTDVYPTANN